MQLTARLPIQSSHGKKLAALLVVFQTPPPTPPTHIVPCWVGCITIERVRPPILPGPSHSQLFVFKVATKGLCPLVLGRAAPGHAAGLYFICWACSQALA